MLQYLCEHVHQTTAAFRLFVYNFMKEKSHLCPSFSICFHLQPSFLSYMLNFTQKKLLAIKSKTEITRVMPHSGFITVRNSKVLLFLCTFVSDTQTSECGFMANVS